MRVQDFHLPTHGWMDLQDSNPSSTSCSCRVLRPKSTVFMVRKELSIESPTSAAVVKELSSPHGSIPATTFSRFATAVVVDRPGAARGRAGTFRSGDWWPDATTPPSCRRARRSAWPPTAGPFYPVGRASFTGLGWKFWWGGLAYGRSSAGARMPRRRRARLPPLRPGFGVVWTRDRRSKAATSRRGVRRRQHGRRLPRLHLRRKKKKPSHPRHMLFSWTEITCNFRGRNICS